MTTQTLRVGDRVRVVGRRRSVGDVTGPPVDRDGLLWVPVRWPDGDEGLSRCDLLVKEEDVRV